MHEGNIQCGDLFSISTVHPDNDGTTMRPVQNYIASPSHSAEDIKFEIGPGAIVQTVTPPLMQHMTKEQVEELIRCNPDDSRFEFLPNVKGKSKAWRNFKILLFEGVPQDFARCNLCSAIVTYSNRTGTGALLRHKCNNYRNNADDKTKKAIPFVHRKKVRMKNRKLSGERKRWLIEKEAEFVITDLLPVKTVDSSGFRNLAQALIDAGADFGKRNVDDVLLDGHALLNTYISEMCGRIRNDTIGTILSNTVSFTCDFWTSGCSDSHYLTLTGHVLDNFQMKRFVLGTRQVLNGTPENIHNSVINILSEYVGDALTEAKLREGTIVRDNRANLCEAFSSYSTLPCACYMLNSVIQGVMQNLKEFNDILTSARRLTTLFEQHNLNSKLSKSLTNGDTTRWNLVYYMFRDIYEMQTEIQNIMFGRDEYSWFEELDLNAVRDTIEFLDLFKDCSESLGTDSQPTLHEVVLWKMKIESHCKPNGDDSALVAGLKRETLHQFSKSFSLHHLHYVALFLDPNFKKMKKLDENERRTTVITIKGLLKHASNEKKTTSMSITCDMSEYRRCKLSLSESNQKFRDFKDSSSEDEEETDEITEVNRYMARKFGHIDDVLGFWKTNTEFPNLRHLVRRVLNIPACSSLSEKLFSRNGQVLNMKRARLSGDHVDELLLLHNNIE